MKKILGKVKNTKGYISIETVIVAGLVIGLGVLTISAFQSKANDVSKKALSNVETANTNYNVVDPTK